MFERWRKRPHPLTPPVLPRSSIFAQMPAPEWDPAGIAQDIGAMTDTRLVESLITHAAVVMDNPTMSQSARLSARFMRIEYNFSEALAVMEQRILKDGMAEHLEFLPLAQALFQLKPSEQFNIASQGSALYDATHENKWGVLLTYSPDKGAQTPDCAPPPPKP